MWEMIRQMVAKEDVKCVGSRHRKEVDMKTTKVQGTEQTQPTLKKLYLTEEERTNVSSRENLIKEYQYLIHVVGVDIETYVRYAVLKRLGLPVDTTYTLAKDNAFLEVPHESNTDKKG